MAANERIAAPLARDEAWLPPGLFSGEIEPKVECYRCGEQVSALTSRFRRWFVVHARRGFVLWACEGCQMAPERRVVRGLARHPDPRRADSR
jgi:hypothetical protein